MWQSQVISGRHDEKKERQVKNTGYFIQKTAQQKFRLQRLLTQSSKDKLVLFTYSIRKKSPDKILVSKYETQEREFFSHASTCMGAYKHILSFTWTPAQWRCGLIPTCHYGLQRFSSSLTWDGSFAVNRLLLLSEVSELCTTPWTKDSASRKGRRNPIQEFHIDDTILAESLTHVSRK